MPLNITKPPASRPHHCRISFFSYFFQGLKEKRSLELIVRCCAVFNDDWRGGCGWEILFQRGNKPYSSQDLCSSREMVFIVYDPNRKIISRFDSYGPDSEPKDELVILMDANGNGFLTLHRKVSSFFLTTFGGSSPGLTIIININVFANRWFCDGIGSDHDQMHSDSADDYLQDIDPTSEEFSS
ncbi:hypothetical protein POTOM_057627 [Populus tomentosa]|uniref:Uncharacterized protein n=1 Tax=Populus tomentosa TaxID=118781 RepID=A0A8X7XXA4_POPTO|nr:hypothetical protein POTOM_057627 [Populus tomentosa]